MRIKQVKLRNFKRFTDLTISDIPESAKLVLVVGPNGCGKSSLFDGFWHWYRLNSKLGIHGDESYFRKSEADFGWHNIVDLRLHCDLSPKRGCLYVRTAYRNDPEFNVSSINKQVAPSEQLTIASFIQNDMTVGANYQRLVYDTTAAVYDISNDTKSVQSLREELIGQIRSSMRAVFGDLVLNSISDPLGSGAFFFEKGVVRSYNYKNLSGGEKAAFDLILDLHLKKKYYSDAIYCIDEAETHLHTSVQGKLLKELVSIVPDTGQLWVTTHSLGVLRAAQELEVSNPGSVCVIDFDGTDLDQPTVLTASSLGRVAWEKMLSIAIDDLSARIAPEIIVVCEGSSVGNRRKDFDAAIYNKIFRQELRSAIFVSGGSSGQVAGAGINVDAMLRSIYPSAKVVALADRDDKSQTEVEEFERSGNIVLSLRNLESYLFADDILEQLLIREQKQHLKSDILQMKQDKLQASFQRRNASDDLKSAAGDIVVELKRRLGLRQCGNTADAFMRDTLAPLITPSTQTYAKLKADVIQRIV